MMQPSNPSSHLLVDHLFRHESGKMVSVLTRIFGVHNIEMAEDVMQEAFLRAMQTWKYNKAPENPAAWLMMVAKNKAMDIIRREQRFNHLSIEVAEQLQKEADSTVAHFFLDTEIADSQLRMIFTCCHPSLKQEDQLALTLKTVSGFGVAEIARALVTTELVVQQRLYRAKQFIKTNQTGFEIPSGAALNQRLETVYTVLYLLFNEGYNSVKEDELIRQDICAEAMRLSIFLSEHTIGKKPTTFALLSLMCFHASRFESRLDENKEIILLQNQDRNTWNKTLIDRGHYYLNLASTGNDLSVYHIEAAIAAEYSFAPSFALTNWHRLIELYDMLLLQKDMPVVYLNRAIIWAQLNESERAIREILSIEGIEKILATQYLYNAVLGDLYHKLNDGEKAVAYLTAANCLTVSLAEKKLIEEKIKNTGQRQ